MYYVTLTTKNHKWYALGHTWTASKERASTYGTPEDAQKLLVETRRYMRKETAKNIAIEKKE